MKFITRSNDTLIDFGLGPLTTPPPTNAPKNQPTIYPKPQLPTVVFCWLLLIVSCYLLLVNTWYLCKTWKLNKQRKENVICCLTSLSPLANAFWFVLFTTDALPGFDFCLTFLMNNYTTLSFSKVLTNIVFCLRYKSLNRKHYCTSILITVVIAATVAAHQLYIYVLFFHLDRDLCRPGFRFQDDVALFASTVVVAVTNLVLQTATVVGVILPIRTHCNKLGCGAQGAHGAQGKTVKGVLRRVVICSSVFTLAEVFFIVFAIFSRTQFITVFVCSSLTVNTSSLVFSFSDYRDRYFPFCGVFDEERKSFKRIAERIGARIDLRVVEAQPERDG